MKKFNRYLILIFIFFLFTGTIYANFDISKWRYYKNIIGVSISNPSLIGVELDKEIFKRANNNLSDIRIIDDNNENVAYVVRSEISKTKIKNYSPAVLNLSNVVGKYTSFVVDFGSNVVHNSLEILTDSKNFRKNVQISGSNNNKNWQVLEKDKTIYDYSLEFNIKNTTLKYPESSFRYLLIKISDTNEKPIKISGVSAKKIETSKEKRIIYKPVYKFFTKDKKTFLLVDKGQKGLETDKIILEINSDNFERYVSVYSSTRVGDWKNNKKNFSNIGNGILYSYKTGKLNNNKF